MGVSLALKKLDSAVQGQKAGQRTCTLGPIIHNPQVLQDYAARGVSCLADPDELHAGDMVVIRAHGITRDVENKLRQKKVTIVDATCPKVKKAQLAIARATAGGKNLLLFGEADHPEVCGLVSYAQGAAHVFNSLQEATALELPPDLPCVLASQTTQDKAIFQKIETSLRQGIAELTVLPTICDATRERQEEARQIASRVEAMVIVGGRQSGNTRRLADVAALCGIETYLVEGPEELQPENFVHKKRVGLTAGASTPKSIIDATQQWLESQ